MSTTSVLGLGAMGGRVAAALARVGPTHGFDPLPEARARAAESGVHVHEKPEEAVALGDVVVLSLPTPAHVRAAVAGPLTSAASGSVVIDISTIDPGTARSAAETLAVAGVGYVDAPVLGRPDRCGHWTLPVGGSESAVATTRAVLEGVVAARIVHVGEVGAGSVVKVINNLMFGAINTVTAEALTMCRLAGVDPQVFVQTVADSGAATVSSLFRELAPRLLDDDYDPPTFALALLHKDNRLAVDLARDTGAPAFVATTVDQVNTLALQQGLGALDSGAVHLLYRRLSPVAEPS